MERKDHIVKTPGSQTGEYTHTTLKLNNEEVKILSRAMLSLMATSYNVGEVIPLDQDELAKTREMYRLIDLPTGIVASY